MNALEFTNDIMILLTTYFHFLYTDGFLLTAHPSIEGLVKDAELAT